jgi:hypothetical protein
MRGGIVTRLVDCQPRSAGRYRRCGHSELNEVSMTALRKINPITVIAFALASALHSQQQLNPDRLFVRVQTQLRRTPSATAPETMVVRPGTLLTAIADTPQSTGFVRVTRDDGQSGWVLATAVRALAILEAEQQLEAFGGLEGVRPLDRTFPAAKAKAQCQPFPSCPMTGCATEAAHKLTNTRKRTFPKSTVTKVLTFDELDLLQALTDSKGVPQGEHLTAAERKQLTNSLRSSGGPFHHLLPRADTRRVRPPLDRFSRKA